MTVGRHPFGSLATHDRDRMHLAFERGRGPMALRHRLTTVLPLSRMRRLNRL